MELEIGISAPAFELYNQDKQKISLESLRGQNVLLHFFPLAFTSVCTQQLCNARDNMEVYTRLNCTVLGISVDSLYSLAEFRRQQGFTFDLLSDFNKTTIRNYGIYLEQFSYDMKGISKRAAFVIDREGIIRYAEITPTLSDQPDYRKIVATLETLP